MVAKRSGVSIISKTFFFFIFSADLTLCLGPLNGGRFMDNATFRLTIDGVILREIVKYILKFDSEPTFKVSDENMVLNTINVERTSTLKLKMMERLMIDYHADKEGCFAADLKMLYKALRGLKMPGRNNELDESVTLECDGRSMIMKFQGQKHIIPLLKPKVVEVPEPNFDYECKVKVLAKPLYEAVKQAVEYDQRIVLKANGKELQIYSNGDRGSFTKDFKPYVDEVIYIDSKSDRDVKSYYDGRQLTNILNLPLICDYITLNLSGNSPLKIEFIDPDVELTVFLATMNSKLTFEAKPKIREERKVVKEDKVLERSEDKFTLLVQAFCRHEHIMNGRCVTCGKVIGK